MSKHDKPSTSEKSKEHVHDVLREMKTVMLCQSEQDGSLKHARVRPMSVAKVEDDGSLLFLTTVEGARGAEHATGRVVAQTARRYVDLVGRLEVTQDKSRIDEVWSKAAEAWFPRGKTDPTIAVLSFHPTDAEIWDIAGAKGVRFVIDAIGAIVRHERLNLSGKEMHERVSMK